MATTSAPPGNLFDNLGPVSRPGLSLFVHSGPTRDGEVGGVDGELVFGLFGCVLLGVVIRYFLGRARANAQQEAQRYLAEQQRRKRTHSV